MPVYSLHALNELDAATWDGLLSEPQPFLRHAFLSTLEDSGSVGGRSGWQAAHQVLLGDEGQPLSLIHI